MSNTVLKSVCAAALAALCAAPVAASQQDDASHRRVQPAKSTTATAPPATTGAAAPAAPVPASNAAAVPAVIRKYQITASEGHIVPGHIHAKRGEVVRITFVSSDDTYGIRFKDFGVKEKLTPDKPVVVELHPTTPGTYEFRCTKTWGVSHWTHNGALVIE